METPRTCKWQAYSEKKKKGYFDTFRKSEAGNLKIKTKNTYRHLQQCFENQKYITKLCKISALYTFRVSHDAQNLTHLWESNKKCSKRQTKTPEKLT